MKKYFPLTLALTGFATTGVTPARASRWLHHIAEWRSRTRSRNELSNLSDRTLRDIGVSRCDAHWEASKPFWMA
jgi:uncharacterized protein YjiS (DUF1127 family)